MLVPWVSLRLDIRVGTIPVLPVRILIQHRWRGEGTVFCDDIDAYIFYVLYRVNGAVLPNGVPLKSPARLKVAASVSPIPRCLGEVHTPLAYPALMSDPDRTRITPIRGIYEHMDEVSLELEKRYPPGGFADRFALAMVKALRFIADTFFAKRYGNRAIVLETVAAVPGMVGGTMQHLKCLRRLCDDEGWIFTLLDEAENERMHLMAFMEIIHPTWYERLTVVTVQVIFYNAFFLLYLISDRSAHRLVGYFEEEAVISYTQYLQRIDSGDEENVPAPQLAIDYWGLAPDARLREMVEVIRADEVMHRDTNHRFADRIAAGEHY